MRVADHPLHTGEGREFFGRALRITAGDQDLRLGIGALYAAHGGAGIGIGRGSHGAGIEHNKCGSGLACTEVAPVEQRALDGGAVRLSGAATEIDNVECAHDRTRNRSRLEYFIT